MERKSICGKTKFEELEKPVNITISTKVPTKWVFVDMETGDMWVKENGRFKRANRNQKVKNALKKIIL